MSESKSITSDSSTLTPEPAAGPGGCQRTVEEDRQSMSLSSESDSSISTSSDESTLAAPMPGPGAPPSTSQGQQTVNDRLQQTLAAAERKRDALRRRARMHRWAINGAILVLLLVGGFANLVAVVTKGEQRKFAIMIMGGVVDLVALYLFLALDSEASHLEASCQRLLEMDRYISDLRVFTIKHGRRTWSGIGPEMRARVVRKQHRLMRLMGSSVESCLDLYTESDRRDSV